MFVKVNEQRAKQNQRDGAYEKLEDDLSKLKEQIDKANNAKALLSDLFGQISSTTPTNRNENQPDLIRNHTDAR
jgi:gas vesicle protein